MSSTLHFWCVLYSPAVGPVYETDDPNQFMQHMENLMALGGGDEPEMCLSAIQVISDAVSFVELKVRGSVVVLLQ